MIIPRSTTPESLVNFTLDLGGGLWGLLPEPELLDKVGDATSRSRNRIARQELSATLHAQTTAPYLQPDARHLVPALHGIKDRVGRCTKIGARCTDIVGFGLEQAGPIRSSLEGAGRRRGYTGQRDSRSRRQPIPDRGGAVRASSGSSRRGAQIFASLATASASCLNTLWKPSRLSFIVCKITPTRSSCTSLSAKTGTLCVCD